MDFKGYITNIDKINSKIYISLETENQTILPEIQNLFNSKKLMKIEIKKFRKKRSLDANSFLWSMIDKISQSLNVERKMVYMDLIHEGGVFEIVPVKENAKDRWIQNWEERGEGWFCEEMPSKLKGFTNVKNFFGSSVYDSTEMGRIIELAKQECEQLGIETLDNDEINNLLKEWKLEK